MLHGHKSDSNQAPPPPHPDCHFLSLQVPVFQGKIKIFYHVDVLMENLPFHLGQDLDGDFVLQET